MLQFCETGRNAAAAIVSAVSERAPEFLEADGLAIDHAVCRIRELEQYLVRARRQPDQDDRLSTRIDEMPGRIVDGDVDVTDTRRHVERAFAEHRYHPQIFRSVLDEDQALGQLFGKRWIDDQPGRRLVFDGDQRRRPAHVPGALGEGRRPRTWCRPP